MPTNAPTKYAHFRMTPEDYAHLDAITAHLTATDPARRETTLTDALRFALRQAAENIPKKISKRS